MGTPSLGALVRQERRLRGLTQDQLAGLTGISQTKISRLENDEQVPLDLNALASLSHHIGIPVKKLQVAQRRSRDLDERVADLESFSETLVKEVESLKGLIKALQAAVSAQ